MIITHQEEHFVYSKLVIFSNLEDNDDIITHCKILPYFLRADCLQREKGRGTRERQLRISASRPQICVPLSTQTIISQIVEKSFKVHHSIFITIAYMKIAGLILDIPHPRDGHVEGRSLDDLHKLRAFLCLVLLVPQQVRHSPIGSRSVLLYLLRSRISFQDLQHRNPFDHLDRVLNFVSYFIASTIDLSSFQTKRRLQKISSIHVILAQIIRINSIL